MILTRSLPFALLVGAIAQLVILEVLSHEDDRISRAIESPAKALFWVRCWRTLLGARAIGTFTVLAFAASRLDSFVLSIFAGPVITGAYGAVYSVYLAAVGVLFGALQVVVPLRRNALDGAPTSHRRITALRHVCLIAGAIVGGVMAWQAPRIARSVLTDRSGDAAAWLAILAISVPFLLANRSSAMEAIARRNYWGAARVVAIPALGGLVILLVLVPTIGATGAALATCTQEILGTVAIGILWLSRLNGRRQVKVAEA
jgi:O-antigen/teichoic acid export membrane protein